MPQSNPFLSLCQRAALAAGVLSAAFAAAAAQAARADDHWSFHVTIDEAAAREPYTGRLYVLFSRQSPEPRMGPAWFDTEPFIAVDVEALAPEKPFAIDPTDEHVLTYPRSFDGVSLDGMRAQAVARLNPWERNIGTGPGNAYSAVTLLKGDPHTVDLRVNAVVPNHEFEETHWSKLLSVRSDLLSEFYGHDVFLKAAVILPASYYDEPERHYPTIFSIPGFSGTHFAGRRTEPIDDDDLGGVEFLRVVLDPSAPLGHHVFADSANNGPVGKALIEELIPAFDAAYRSIADPGARFVTGHSSGGWSSLWLQVTYPEAFGGVWSTSPDPVDFRDFQRINLYRAGENMYVDPDGNRRPLARNGSQVLIWYDDFAWMEHVAGPGGQLHSFEAVFSPRGPDGKPLLLWNRETGEIDTAVAETWKPYDIRLILEEHWHELGPKLRGKLHVFVGDQDTFYLDGATVLLKEALQRLGSDAVVEIHPGKDHGSLLTRQLRDRIRHEMAQTFLKNFPNGTGTSVSKTPNPTGMEQEETKKTEVNR
jgi:Putative esterase